jgi:hypothetical protein
MQNILWEGEEREEHRRRGWRELRFDSNSQLSIWYFSAEPVCSPCITGIALWKRSSNSQMFSAELILMNTVMNPQFAQKTRTFLRLNDLSSSQEMRVLRWRNMDLWNVGILPQYTASQPRRPRLKAGNSQETFCSPQLVMFQGTEENYGKVSVSIADLLAKNLPSTPWVLPALLGRPASSSFCLPEIRCSSVSILTRLLDGRPWFDSRKEQEFFSSLPRSDRFWGPPNLLSYGY